MQRHLRGLAVLACLAAAFPAWAQTPPNQPPPPASPTAIGGAKGWLAYSYHEKGGKTCYLAGHPAKTLPSGAARGRVDAVIAHRLGDKAYNVVTFDLGYAAKDGTKAELAIDGKKYQLFVEKNAAWASDSPTDKAITEALARGRAATLKAISARGVATTDTYLLDGFGQALEAIDKACNYKR
ncbi:MAG TPA: invasion associated locus B family protein [Stellaceae bacterium]|jgi:hypothetical protein|nr:invasion associated locus B family protein [Stellaceae bacterium]